MPGRVARILRGVKRSWFLLGIGLYLALGFVVFPLIIGVPSHISFVDDAWEYSLGALNLLKAGLYSLDGITPYADREPGMSFFLLPLYAAFGIANPLALWLGQGIVFGLAAWYFCTQFARSAGSRAAGISFVLLLTSGSVFHSLFTAYRECLTLSLLMVFAGAVFAQYHKHAWWKVLLIGLALSAAVLTYYPLIFFVPAFALFWLIDTRKLGQAIAILLIAASLPFAWAVRNKVQTGTLQVLGGSRTAVMWYVRGEQAERVQGLEPFRCLWAEYISRDWTGRSDACSFNGLMHQRWPDGFAAGTDHEEAARSGQAKILAHPVSYLWFSIVDIIELHLPFVGGGISTEFNAYAAATALLMYVGCVLSLRHIVRRKYAFLLLLIAYNTAIFALTDATPRYLVPVIFAYAALAGIGYDVTLTFHSRLWHPRTPSSSRS